MTQVLISTEIPLALNEIEIFGSFSGLIMNKDKTEGLWIGKLKHCKDKVGGIKWTDKPVKTLGIYFGHDKEECERLNWENKFYFIRFIIPNKFEAFAIYFFPIFFWNNTCTSHICKYWNN
jgi:hypothetical protein